MENEYADFVQDLAADWPELAHEFAPFNTLENVMEWMKRQGLPLSRLDLVTQDEFTHDVLVPLDESGRHVVFGIT